MQITTEDKLEVIRYIMKDCKITPLEVSKATGVYYFNVIRLLNCEDEPVNLKEVDAIMIYLEGKKQEPFNYSCAVTGCIALMESCKEKDRIIELLNENNCIMAKKMKEMRGGS